MSDPRKRDPGGREAVSTDGSRRLEANKEDSRVGPRADGENRWQLVGDSLREGPDEAVDVVLAFSTDGHHAG